jgi:hypothetical protein
VAIVRGHRLGMPHDPVRFQDEDRKVTTVEVLDPAAAGQASSARARQGAQRRRVEPANQPM